MAPSPLSSQASSLFRTLGIVVTSAAVGASVSSKTNDPAPARFERLEVVNEKGETCLVLEGTDAGGNILWMNPGMEVE